MRRISELSLFDEFSIRGRWWLPARETETLPGELNFSGDGITLDLDGKFGITELQDTAFLLGVFKAPIIVGETTDGEYCMLLRTFTTRVSGSSCSFEANQLLIGDHPFGENQLAVERLLIEFTHLEDWASVQLIRTDHGSTGTFKIIVPTNRVELLKLESDHGFKTLTLLAGTETQFKLGDVRCTVHCQFDVSFQKPLQISESIQFVSQLGNLLSLLVGTAVYPKKIRLVSPIDGAEPSTVDFFSASRRIHAETKRAREMLLPLRELNEEGKQIFNSWFAHTEELKPVYDLLLSTIYGKQYMQTIFLNLMQAIESFHRRVHGGQIVKAEDYAPVRDALVRAIPAGTDTGLEEKLRGVLEYGNEPSLKQRLRFLCETMRPETLQSILAVEDLARFLQLLADLRNYLTHYNEALKPRIRHITGDPMASYNLNQRLRAFATLVILKHLGLAETMVASRLSSHLNLAS